MRRLLNFLRSKEMFKYLVIVIFLASIVLALLYVDFSPQANSFRSEYNGYVTNSVHEPKAHLSNSTDNIFWFVQITDVHIGAYRATGDNRQAFRDFFNNIGHVDPEFIVDTGDLTNAIIPLPLWQDVEQWRDRYNILMAAGVNNSFYYDLPGNHDGYNDSDSFSFFLNWSIQQNLQYTWNRTFTFGNYTFIGLNSAANTGEQWPGGTDGDLDRTELDWLELQLNNTQNSNLTFVFSHHQMTGVGHNTTNSGRTFVELLEIYNVSAHIYGHGHSNHELNQGGTVAIMTDSLGQTFDKPGYRIFAVDNDGFSCKFQYLNEWPAVIITCPIDRGLTMQAFDIPNDSKVVPIRALAFDQNPISTVEFKIDTGNWTPMTLVSGDLWNSSFDASSLPEGEHTITVRATSSSGSITDSIQIRIGSPNRPEIVNGPLPDFIRTRDSSSWVLNLSMYEWDRIDSGTQLNWSVSSVDLTLCSVEVTNILNDLVTFIPVSGASGSDQVNFTLINSNGQTISQMITINLVDSMSPGHFQLYLSLIIIGAIVGAVVINQLLLRRAESGKKQTIKQKTLSY